MRSFAMAPCSQTWSVGHDMGTFSLKDWGSRCLQVHQTGRLPVVGGRSPMIVQSEHREDHLAQRYTDDNAPTLVFDQESSKIGAAVSALPARTPFPYGDHP